MFLNSYGVFAVERNFLAGLREPITGRTNPSDFVKCAAQNCKEWLTLGQLFRLPVGDAENFAFAANLATRRRSRTRTRMLPVSF